MFTFTRITGGPVLKPDPQYPWENEGVFNPGIIEKDGKILMLYRAVGERDAYISHLGLATSTDGLAFERAYKHPVFSPSQTYDKWAVEDPRITKIGENYYVTYVAVPERIMDHGKGIDRKIPLETATALLSTRDFVHYQHLGIISAQASDNKDIVIFPEKVPCIPLGAQHAFTEPSSQSQAAAPRMRYAMLHRPNRWTKDWHRSPYADKVHVDLPCPVQDLPEHPSIWISWSDDLIHWTDHRLLIQTSDISGIKIGPGLPPIRTEDGWLIIYHHVFHDKLKHHFSYTARAALFDLNDPTRLIGILPYDVLTPATAFEKENGTSIVFPTGGYVKGDRLRIYYGCSDRYIAVAEGSLSHLLEELKKAGPTGLVHPEDLYEAGVQAVPAERP